MPHRGSHTGSEFSTLLRGDEFLTHRARRIRAGAGFTIVELLIVIVVIAVLAVITIVSYNGITARAKNTQFLASFDAYEKAIRLYHAETGTYPIASEDNQGQYPEGSYCLGANFPATDELAEGDCVSASINGRGVISLGYKYNQEVTDQITGVAAIPNVDYPYVKLHVAQSGVTIDQYLRGIHYYVSLNPNINNGDVYIGYYIRSDQVCGRGVRVDYESLGAPFASCRVYFEGADI